jgi:glycosyltransferase involved in cell wall biosynthesis
VDISRSPAEPDAPLRVLHVLLLDALGGTERIVATLAEHLQTSSLSTDVAILAAPGPISARLREQGIAVASLGDPLPIAAWRLARHLRTKHYDVINAYGLKASLVARALSRVLSPKSKFVVGVRGLIVTETENESGLKARLAAATERRTSGWVAVYDSNSLGAVEVLVEAGIDRSRCRYIPNGIDVSLWPAKDWAPVRDAPPLIACVARFVPRKRQQDIVLAVERMHRDGVPCQVAFAGDGPTLDEVRRLTCHLGLDDSIRFLGGVPEPEIRDLLREADVFCLASSWEGMAGSVLEAMATGLPVVATRVNGIQELVVDGETGSSVPPGRPDLLARELREVLVKEDRRKQLGDAGRKRVESEFSLQRMLDAKSHLYRELSGR